MKHGARDQKHLLPTMAFVPPCTAAIQQNRPFFGDRNVFLPADVIREPYFRPRHRTTTELNLFARVAAPVIQTSTARAGRLFGAGTTSVIGLAALTLGLIIGRLTARWSGPQRLTNAEEVSRSSFSFDENAPQDELSKWEGTTPTWLNDALVRMWSLFQSNTKRLVKDGKQNELDLTRRST